MRGLNIKVQIVFMVQYSGIQLARIVSGQLPAVTTEEQMASLSSMM